MTTDPLNPFLCALLYYCGAHSGHILSLFSPLYQYSLKVLFHVMASDSRYPVRHVWTRASAFCLTTQPLPSGQGAGYFLASICQSTAMGNGTPQQHWNNILRCVTINSKPFQGFPHPQPYAQQHRYVCLPITLRVFSLTVPIALLFAPSTWGSLMTVSLLCRESERTAPGFNCKDVNYAGDRLALMRLYWHLYHSLRKNKADI